MMSLLPVAKLFLSLIIGFVEYYLVLKRTVTAVKLHRWHKRKDRWVLRIIIAAENILGAWVIYTFITEQNWLIMISYTIGAVLSVDLLEEKEKEDETRPDTSNISNTNKN